MRQRALQTRVDLDIVQLAKQAAAREGEDVSNWLRRLVTRELRPSPALIEAWVGAPKSALPYDGLNPERKAQFYLAPAGVNLSGDRDFVIYDALLRRLTGTEHSKNRRYWELAERQWIFLRSSPTPWVSMGQMQHLDGNVMLTLRRVL
jgi:hypothetical protein